MEEMTGSCLRGLRTRVWRTVKMFMIHCAEEIANMCIHMCVCDREREKEKAHGRASLFSSVQTFKRSPAVSAFSFRRGSLFTSCTSCTHLLYKLLGKSSPCACTLQRNQRRQRQTVTPTSTPRRPTQAKTMSLVTPKIPLTTSSTRTTTLL